MGKKALSFRRLLKSFGYALRGIRMLISEEQNARVHLFIFCCVVIAGLALHLSPTEWIVVVIVSGNVFAAEAVNSSIEELSDAVSPERNPKIKLVKDLAAGAVLLTAIAAAITGLIIFVPKIAALF